MKMVGNRAIHQGSRDLLAQGRRAIESLKLIQGHRTSIQWRAWRLIGQARLSGPPLPAVWADGLAGGARPRASPALPRAAETVARPLCQPVIEKGRRRQTAMGTRRPPPTS